ncbi:phospholipase D-like domain-containing protein [Legionella sp. CNM-1927-20]|uniref:phospholipase D-like domain-containing protein n=1 Tax=Legionella sp. CNM-1927-20 TaxID=3422221 RepID=UPI00403AB516
MNSIIVNVLSVVDKGWIPQKKLLSVVDINQIEFALKGEQIFDLIINEIKKAKRQVLIQTFAWDRRTKFVHDLQSALIEIGRRKLNQGDNIYLDVFILLDELGPLAQLVFRQKKPINWPHSPKDLGLSDLPDNIRIHIGVHHHNWLDAAHSKTVLIDNNTVIITGANFQVSNYGPKCNYDAAILLKGNSAHAAFFDFTNNWKKRSNASEEDIVPTYVEENISAPTDIIEEKNRATVLYLASKLRRNYTSGLFVTLPSEPINNAFMAALGNAQNIIRITTPNLNELSILSLLLDFINKRDGILELILGKGFNDRREKMYGGTNDAAVARLLAGIAPDKSKKLNIKWYSKIELILE